ncbi:hypothetical protein [Actinoplanes auranticolor]|uniref:Uncharacterized protein n=1 Tax=Actinoplanes auranticolor TaxID=47988 RepID=A0A919SJ33_9ACTN|nr:hypothetical protein [Actinoplanes auranticolor]GIM72437.1 hypothetical protein Aau02nite_50980 [Actinoplanes auranticolor]
MALRRAERPGPADHQATAEVLHLLDDLVRLIDVATAAADTPQRGHAMTVADKIRDLRQRLDPAQQVTPTRYSGPWYDDLVSALGDLRGVAWEALRVRLDELEAGVERLSTRPTRRRWWH